MKRPLLLPLVPLYAAGVAWKARGWDSHPERAERLHDPVVSIGSLSAGGAGKTPFVMALGEALRRAGYDIDVLSRGHGRASHENLRVDPLGSADQFGDEPLLMAQRMACPVYVARERYRAGQMAETDRRVVRADHRLSLHLLDDGFQHRQLARAVDIVLFTAEDARDTLLPAGNLREPLHALRRAHILVVRHGEREALQPVLQEVFAGLEMPPLWTIGRKAAMVESAVSKRPLAFCGIARPEGFRTSLQQWWVEPAGLIALKDHQHYNDAVIATLIANAKKLQADGFITTAKDAVKLTPALRTALAAVGPLAVVDVQVRLRDEQALVSQLMAMVERWRKQPRP